MLFILNGTSQEKMWEINKKIRKVHDWEEIPFAVEGNHKKS